jgi:Spy/CpxP family protein refolding chaperone
MNAVKVYIILTIFSLFTGTATFAQSIESKLSPEQIEQLKANSAPYIETLNLTEEQKQQFSEVMLENAQNLLELKELKDSGASKLTLVRKKNEVEKENEENVKRVLSESQYEKYLGFRDELREKQKAVIQD